MSLELLPDRIFEEPRLAGHEWRLRRRIAGRHTILSEYTGRGPERRRIFVKRFEPRTSGGVDPRLVREFRALTILQRRLGPVLGSSTPAPVALVAEDHALVMEAVAGVPLVHVLKRDANLVFGSLRLRALQELGRSVARWLAEFQRLTARAAVVHDHAAFSRALSGDLERLPGAGADAELQRQVERLHAASRAIDHRPLPAAGRHSDFLPQNILVGTGHIAVVDFENYRPRDCVHRDVGSLVAYLRLLGQRRGYLPRALRAFEAGFVSGYGPAASGPIQDLHTAAAAARIARDARIPEARQHLVHLLSTLPL